MLKKSKEKIKKHFQEVLEIKTTPQEIALGFAIGTFFANFPTFGIELLFIFLILIIFKKVSKVALLFAYVIWNPLITYPLAAVSYLIGDSILGDAPVIIIRFALFQDIIQFTVRYILGSIILATSIALISYYVVLYLAKKYQKKEIPILQKPLEISDNLEIPALKI